MEHDREDRPLDREREAAAGEQFLDHRPAAGLLPQPAEDQRRADLPCLRPQLALLTCAAHEQGLSATVLSAATIRQALVEPEARLLTDQAAAFTTFGKERDRHETVNHSAKELVRGSPFAIPLPDAGYGG